MGLLSKPKPNKLIKLFQNFIIRTLLFVSSKFIFLGKNEKLDAEKLYSKVVDYALEKKEAVDNTVVMDLFCGTGTIGQILASRSTNAQIIGVEAESFPKLHSTSETHFFESNDKKENPFAMLASLKK